MNDKSKRPNDDRQTPDNDKLFLDKNGVKEIIGDLISQLTANRPSDPLMFMANYFESSSSTSVNRLEKCQQTIKLTHHSRAAFQQNVAAAFDILNQTKIGKHMCGINGAIFDELFQHLLSGVPTKVVILMRSKLSLRPAEVVDYVTFHYSVTAVMVLKDYLELGHKLFDLLETGDSVDKAQAEALSFLLKEAFSKSVGSNSQSLEACYTLSPVSIHTTLSQVKSDGKQRLSLDQFTELIAESYISCIR